MTHQLLDKIEAAAKAATPGEWIGADNYVIVDGLDGERGHILFEAFGANPMLGDNCNDTYYLALMNPATALKLVRALRLAMDEIKECYFDSGTHEYVCEEINKILEE